MALIKTKKTWRLLFLTHPAVESINLAPLEPPQKLKKKKILQIEEKVKEAEEKFRFTVKAKDMYVCEVHLSDAS